MSNPTKNDIIKELQKAKQKLLTYEEQLQTQEDDIKFYNRIIQEFYNVLQLGSCHINTISIHKVKQKIKELQQNNHDSKIKDLVKTEIIDKMIKAIIEKK